eukprot:4369159-Pyramimonas_sp.AAC.1
MTSSTTSFTTKSTAPNGSLARDHRNLCANGPVERPWSAPRVGGQSEFMLRSSDREALKSATLTASSGWFA